MNVPASGSTGLVRDRDADLAHGQRADGGPGRTSISPSVLATVAGVAARGVRGVHDLGGAATGGALDRVRSALPLGGAGGLADGVPVRQLVEHVRERVIADVEELTGYEVTQVNVAVVDVHLDEEDER